MAPITGRPAGTLQGVVLLAVAVLPVMGSTLIAPILPAMAAHFAHSPGAEILIPVALTVPALCIALFGVAPLALDSLGLIVASRVCVGLTEAAVSFPRSVRSRWPASRSPWRSV